jgi:hypothetical protein
MMRNDWLDYAWRVVNCDHLDDCRAAGGEPIEKNARRYIGNCVIPVTTDQNIKKTESFALRGFTTLDSCSKVVFWA